METPIIETRTKYEWSATRYKRGGEHEIYIDCEGLDSEGNKWAWIEINVKSKLGEIIETRTVDYQRIK